MESCDDEISFLFLDEGRLQGQHVQRGPLVDAHAVTVLLQVVAFPLSIHGKPMLGNGVHYRSFVYNVSEPLEHAATKFLCGFKLSHLGHIFDSHLMI